MTGPRRWWRSTIRVRLTLLYAGAFFVAGTVLIALLYLYLEQILGHQRPTGDLHLSTDLEDALRVQYLQDREDTLNRMLIASLMLLGVVGVIAGGIGWLLAGRALNPLQRIIATARRVADRSMHERIALVGPDDEIKDLADTFDAMLERLDRSFDSQRAFVANASHELRTPLTINRTLIEVALDKPGATEPLRQLGETLLAVNERHERLIDGLLTLASSDQEIADPTPIDLADLARHVTADSQGAARIAGIEIRASLQPAPASGDSVLLERLIQNLVDNAIRYNLPEHGWMTVTTALVDDFAQLTVENSGPLIASSDLPSLFEPFRRLPSTERLADSREASTSRGAGLGLSIVRSVAHAHAGEVDALARDEGGLTVRVRIPARSERDGRERNVEGRG
jgi:signal transduction histidine kinase